MVEKRGNGSGSRIAVSVSWSGSQAGGKTVEKVTVFCINTIHTKILLSLPLQIRG